MDLKLKEMIDSTEELADVIAEQIPGVDTDFGENFKLEMAKFITSAALHGKMKRDALKSLLRETVVQRATFKCCTPSRSFKLISAMPEKFRRISLDL